MLVLNFICYTLIFEFEYFFNKLNEEENFFQLFVVVYDFLWLMRSRYRN